MFETAETVLHLLGPGVHASETAPVIGLKELHCFHDGEEVVPAYSGVGIVLVSEE